jgi:hypothetical protein
MFAVLMAAMIMASVSFAGEVETFTKVFIPNGLAHAEIGDWITFRMADGTTQKHTVVERTGDAPSGEIVVSIESYSSGNALQSTRRIRQAIGEELVEPPVPAGESHSYDRRKETIAFEGAQLEITVLDVKNNGALQRTWYLSPELPVYGTIKKTFANGSSEFEVVDFGFAGQ